MDLEKLMPETSEQVWIESLLWWGGEQGQIPAWKEAPKGKPNTPAELTAAVAWWDTLLS